MLELHIDNHYRFCFGFGRMSGRATDLHLQRHFATTLLRELRRADPRAAVLQLEDRPSLRTPVIGLVDEGEFVPLLRLGAPSAACNVMSLFAYHHRQWVPTFVRGTPAMLAEELAGPSAYLWSIAATLLSDGPAP